MDRSVYYWQECYSPDKIKDLRAKLQPHLFKPHLDTHAAVKKRSEVRVANVKATEPLLNFFMDSPYVANRENFGFHLYPQTHIDHLFYNVYQPGDTYDFHMDAIFEKNAVSDIKLTALLNISDTEYEGGELQLNTGTVITIHEFKPGNAIIFPSYLLHRVAPVIHGTRTTIAMFCCGPKFV